MVRQIGVPFCWSLNLAEYLGYLGGEIGFLLMPRQMMLRGKVFGRAMLMALVTALATSSEAPRAASAVTMLEGGHHPHLGFASNGAGELARARAGVSIF